VAWNAAQNPTMAELNVIHGQPHVQERQVFPHHFKVHAWSTENQLPMLSQVQASALAQNHQQGWQDRRHEPILNMLPPSTPCLCEEMERDNNEVNATSNTGYNLYIIISLSPSFGRIMCKR
jgi:hypothetical protein